MRPATWASLTTALRLKCRKAKANSAPSNVPGALSVPVTHTESGAESIADVSSSCGSSLHGWGAGSSSTSSSSNQYPPIIYPSSSSSTAGSEVSSLDGDARAVAVLRADGRRAAAGAANAADTAELHAAKQQAYHQQQHCHPRQHCQQTLQQQPDLRLTWRSIGCVYKTASGAKPVLHDVWGEAAAGQMQALLGPSGAGKSSLLDILSCRKATGSISGSLLLNGQLVQRAAYSRRIAYVPQDDNFSPIMTSEEVLAFHASMQLPNCNDTQQETGQLRSIAVQQDNPSISNLQEQEQQRQQQRRAAKKCSRVGEVAVRDVLKTVGLSKHASTLVGGRLPGGLLLRGLSSGERRRLSIAVGVLASPSILFLDEPTSGLDSFAALSVMSHLQGLAHASGKAVVAAIHQPRSAIWSLFDKVTLLASGLLIYHGPTAGMVPWLSGQLGYSYKPAAHGLASDWALDLVVVEFAKPGAFQARTMTTLVELQAAANTFKLQYVCDQLYDYSDGRQQPAATAATAATAAAAAAAGDKWHAPVTSTSRSAQ
ncbi:P-loop containing nucleoside triphosphate hydrolase protein [Scenedesmus sp. NREL 46B-D3]|nr:P-loop containing nucleoside triphosphate hydrolase protein [Scenedesmus sp. NREL 46B-D3]